MSFRPIFEGWDIPGRVSRSIRRTFAGIGLNRDTRGAHTLSEALRWKLRARSLDTEAGRYAFAVAVADGVIVDCGGQIESPFRDHLAAIMFDVIDYEGWFAVPDFSATIELNRSDLWKLEDQLKRVETIFDHLDEVSTLAVGFLGTLIQPLIGQHPELLRAVDSGSSDISFEVNLLDLLYQVPETVEHMMQVPFAPDLEPLALTPHLKERLDYNLHNASGGVPGDEDSIRTPNLPTRQSSIIDERVPEAYLDGTPLLKLFDYPLSISLPQQTRFEHQHIVAGSGHGKTQTLQHLILHDLEAVAAGEASIILMDSQSDLINNIARLELFAPGQPLSDRLVLIDPTDLEWPVALNLFDVGLNRLDQYSQLDRERLTNSILELYDFVLGSLLDAGMTQKQTVIFRYITRLLLHIPGATIHTLRELLEDGGYDRYRSHIEKLQGSARAFFENEFNGKEFSSTKRQVLRRLYGILENQTFERMFSHPKSKLDLFSEMNAGKVILINTAKDLLKESGTEIFGRFFIAMIAQAAQERAVLKVEDRLPTFVYIDEANDYFDRNIGIILSQARKYNVGMVLAHQFLGQLDGKLHEAIAANTAIKFAGGVSAKDARALANDLRTDAAFIEKQSRLAFAAFIKGQTERAVSLAIEPGQLEQLPRMSDEERDLQRDMIRQRYAVHHSEIDTGADPVKTTAEEPDELDDGEPQAW
ncbi:type IV secretory system conjugative DNA transfer family protein [Hoeflea poritis]|uniref:Type IV secretory system conjugative DNA transfer family protein n=1 Tax=Hoeflea poritis TaxID=2993659 RepID=A0ABT4VKW1_9HYPH|nr:type IV secretory system conjugative DNA transfer family protein [Hoeflea poritis]MDA4845229.1 type IV secretory system conjugative DNA transfer family protein [Hoeflea poritis]